MSVLRLCVYAGMGQYKILQRLGNIPTKLPTAFIFGMWREEALGFDQQLVLSSFADRSTIYLLVMAGGNFLQFEYAWVIGVM